jgi:hypothetical protein
MKSHAVLVLGSGMPGVSGELNAHAVPTRGGLANEPGEVPCLKVEGFSPSGGNSYESSSCESSSFVSDTLFRFGMIMIQAP